MRKLAVLAAGLAATPGAASAQQAASLTANPPLSPPPYGAPIDLARAKNAIASAVAEATRRGSTMDVAVVDSGANLVAFARRDGTQLASAVIAERKRELPPALRRPTARGASGDSPRRPGTSPATVS